MPVAANAPSPMTTPMTSVAVREPHLLPALRHVMGIDDNPAIAAMLELALVDIGKLRFSAFADGSSALAALGDCRPDLVLLDWQLPGLSGEQTLASLRQDELGSLLPILVVAPRRCPTIVRSAREHGADGILVKPLDPMHLAAQLRRSYLELKRLSH